MTFTRLPDLPGALCAQVDSEIFFPEKGGSTKTAKSICGRCDVREACLDYALTHQERFGIWGAHSERERRHIARARGITQPPLIDQDTLRAEAAIRRNRIRTLLDAGYEVQAIAAELGVRTKTISNDLQAMRQHSELPDTA